VINGYASCREVDGMTADDFTFWAQVLAAPAES
jgi:hypothetical protein